MQNPIIPTGSDLGFKPQHILFRERGLMGRRCGLDGIFGEVSEMIGEFLGRVNVVYCKNSISYDVSRFHETLVRLLTPVELKASIDHDKMQCIFQDKGFFRRMTTENQMKINLHLEDMVHNNELNDERLIHSNEKNLGSYQSQQKQINKLEDEINGNTILNQRQIAENRMNHLEPRKKKIPKRKSRGLESRLYSWIVKQHEKGIILDKQQIMRKGRQIGRNVNFKASQGWYFYFRTRNPRIKQIMRQCQLHKKQLKTQMQVSSQDQSISQAQAQVKREELKNQLIFHAKIEEESD